MPKRSEIMDENINDFIKEKFIKLKALTKIIVSPVKNVSQLDMVVGLSIGRGDIFFVVQLFNLDFIISANINPDIRQTNAPHESQNKGCLLYTSPSPRDGLLSRMPSSA